MAPRHVSPRPNNAATAHYNFVPLPNAVLTVEHGIEVDGKTVKVKPWEHHDRFVPGTISGWVDLEIAALTPLYIRGPVLERKGAWDPRDARHRPEPYLVDGRPAIPGSSLRGMVRSLVEILAFAKIQPVTRARPFFRTVSNDRIGNAYRERMLRGGQKPPGGLLRVDPAGAWSIRCCEILRLERGRFPRGAVAGSANGVPAWVVDGRPLQHGVVWLRVASDGRTIEEVRDARPAGGGWRQGTLVLTGHAPNKKAEFVFLDPDAERVVQIPDSIWDRFHDDDQLTQWQERAFPVDRPTQRARHAPGHLRNGEPVFFLVDEQAKGDDNPDGLVFLGRAQMFRFPYDLGPEDLIPEPLRNAGLDVAETMFGRVGESTIKGRVRFEDAVAVGTPPWTDGQVVPNILSAPKPTAFQHYLTQDAPDLRSELKTYIRGDTTTIRGHKLYWHRWNRDRGIEQVGQRHGQLAEGDTQRTVIEPIRAETKFQGRVRFDNLAPMELGALLTALDLPDGCAHKLGMGKPLGLGSVRIGVKLTRVDRGARYASWGSSGVVQEDGGHYREAFERIVLHHADQSNEAEIASKDGLRRVARLDALFVLLGWEGRPELKSTAGMDLKSFRARPVLPTPHRVAGEAEPPWGQSQPTSTPAAQVRPTPLPPAIRKVPIQKGQQHDGRVEGEPGGYVARFEGDDRVAQIVNQGEVHGLSRATFYVVEGNKRGLKVRFEKAIR